MSIEPTSIVNGDVHTDNTGRTTGVPVLLVRHEILQPALAYCLAHAHDRGVVWMRKVLVALQLFIHYMFANREQCDTHLLFVNFSQRLYTGSFDPMTGLDTASLCWRPMDGGEARNVIGRLSEFFEWLGTRSLGEAINPSFHGGRFDQMIRDAAYRFRRDRTMLGHTWATTGPTGRLVLPAPVIQTQSEDPPAFPDSRLFDLLLNGFRVGKRRDYRNILVTLLCNGAGLRPSEPLHLFFDDVVPDPSDPESALVFIHHPSYGTAPPAWTREFAERRGANRATYLSEQWGRIPRQKYLTSERSGWKGGAHERALKGFAFRCCWFPPQYGHLFLKVWFRYLEEVTEIERDSPYAFINLLRGEIGAPYKLGKFGSAHARAVERIGLRVSKEAGTTGHGHRHAYGRRLKRAEVRPTAIQRAMHHRGVESQAVYTQSTSDELLAELKAGALKLQSAADVAFLERANKFAAEL